MLRRWRKPVTVVIAPEGVVLNSGTIFAPEVDSKTAITSKPSSWLGVLAELEKNAVKIGSEKIRFIVSNHYVRYAILPWRKDIFSQQDWQSLAENNLRALHGNVVDNWKLSVAMQGYGKPLVISAIDQLLFTQLEEVAKLHKWTIEAIEPALMTALNHYRHKIKNNDWLLMTEPEHVLLAESGNGSLVGFSSVRPPSGQEVAESLNLLRRAMKYRHKTETVQIHAFGNNKLLPEATVENMKFNRLSGNKITGNLTCCSMLAALS